MEKYIVEYNEHAQWKNYVNGGISLINYLTSVSKDIIVFSDIPLLTWWSSFSLSFVFPTLLSTKVQFKLFIGPSLLRLSNSPENHT